VGSVCVKLCVGLVLVMFPVSVKLFSAQVVGLVLAMFICCKMLHCPHVSSKLSSSNILGMSDYDPQSYNQ